MLIIIQINVSLYLIYNFLFRALCFLIFILLKILLTPKRFHTLKKKKKKQLRLLKRYTLRFSTMDFLRWNTAYFSFCSNFPIHSCSLIAHIWKISPPKHYVSCLSIYNNGCYKWNNFSPDGQLFILSFI